MIDNPITYELVPNANNNPFIVNAYLRSHFADFPFNQAAYTLYSVESEKFLKKLLSKSLVMLTHLEDNNDISFSFVIYQYIDSQLVLHYTYTKHEFKRQGLIKNTINLILPTPETPIIATHFPKSPKVMVGLRKHFPNIVFDPFYFTRTFNADY